MIQKINKNNPRRNKCILENILLNIFKFYILKYIIKFLQSHDNNEKKKFGFHNFAEHQLRTSDLGTSYLIVRIYKIANPCNNHRQKSFSSFNNVQFHRWGNFKYKKSSINLVEYLS